MTLLIIRDRFIADFKEIHYKIYYLFVNNCTSNPGDKQYRVGYLLGHGLNFIFGWYSFEYWNSHSYAVTYKFYKISSKLEFYNKDTNVGSY